jgi:HlyD family secretion protein
MAKGLAETTLPERAPIAREAEPLVGDVATLLERESPSRHRKNRWWWLALGLLLLAAGVFLVGRYRGAGEATVYQTSPVERGPLTVLVTATGSLEPTDQVDVGSELSGIVAEVAVDDNDLVRAGQVLARLDTSKLEAQARQARAAVEAARARVQEAEATLSETRLALNRTKELYEAELMSRSNLDVAEASFGRAEAAVASARAQTAQAEATLNAIETDVTKAAIRTPIDGVVLSRNVEPGQTVAASFQAPVLFEIAQDLRRMELHVDVDEADVSRVTKGQRAEFTVDAYPNRTFPATIREVSFASKTVEGVVTYEAVLDVGNDELLLRPGMTATAEITVETLEEAVLVPNAALRFTPPSGAEEESRGRSGLVSMLLPRPPVRPRTNGTEPKDRSSQRVWTLKDGVPVSLPVTSGSTDGTRTVVTSGNLEPGLELIVDAGTPGAAR